MVKNERDPNQQGVLAIELANATKNGSIADAYRALQKIHSKDLCAVALMAGFSIPAGAYRDQQASIIAQVVKATRNCTDGYGLQDLTRAEKKEQSNE